MLAAVVKRQSTQWAMQAQVMRAAFGAEGKDFEKFLGALTGKPVELGKDETAEALAAFGIVEE